MIFNVKDFGAVGDGVHDDRVAIQAAVDAAHAAGGGTVYIPEGTYIVSGVVGDPSAGCIMLYDNITVAGDGMGETSIKLQDGWNGDITGIMRTPYNGETNNVTVHDLTIDGNRANTTGKIDGWFNGGAPGSPIQDTNITLDSVEVKDCKAYGFDPHEITVNLTITNCVSHGNGLDGFTLDYQIDAHIENNIAYGNDRNGFNIVTSSHGVELIDNISYGNGQAGIVVQRGSENLPSPHDITITGGSSYGNGNEGVRIDKADTVTISGMDIYGNAKYGIRVSGSAGSVIENNTIHDNSQIKNNGYDEIRINSVDDTNGSSGRVYYSTGTQVLNNTISANGAVHANYAIREMADGSDHTVISGNTMTGVNHNDALLSGAHSVNQLPAMSYVMGSDGADEIHGLVEGASTIVGMLGNDTLIGGKKNDVLIGGQGNDTLIGLDGNDKFLIDAGSDNLYGGNGQNLFKFTGAFADELGHNNATVWDFKTGAGGDKLDLTELLARTGYTGADAVADQVVKFVQNGADTQVMYDADGAAGSGAPTLLATLKNVNAGSLSVTENLVTHDRSVLYSTIAGQSNAKYLGNVAADGQSGVSHLESGLHAKTNFDQIFTLARESSTSYDNIAVGGATVSGEVGIDDPAKVWWYPGEARPGDVLIHAVDKINKQLADLRAQGAVKPIIIWGQGEAEAADIGKFADPAAREQAMQRYIENTRAVFDYIRAHVGSDAQFYIMETGRFNVEGARAFGMSESSIAKSVIGAEYVRRAQGILAKTYEDVHDAVNYTDLPMRADVTPGADPEANPVDYWHLGTAARQIVGDRLADFIALDLGQTHVINRHATYNVDMLTDLTIHAGTGLTVEGTVASNIISGTTGNDSLHGHEGDDAIVGGAGNDSIYGDAGADTLFGGAGGDTFVYDHATAFNGVDVIKDFSLTQGDKIDISSLLQAANFHPLTHNLSDFVSITTDGNGNSVLCIDRDGAGSAFGMTPIAILSGVTGLPNVQALAASGALVTHSFDHAPVAKDDSFSVLEDHSLTGNVLADNGHGADTDIDGDALTVAVGSYNTAQGGTVNIAADGSFTYVPAANYTGDDSFSYVVRDIYGVESTGVARITVTAVNDAPNANNDDFVMQHGQELSGNVLADNGHGGDTDAENDTLTVEAGVFATVHNGVITLSSDGSFTYVPNENHYGSDTFEYTVSDGHGGLRTATINIFVNAPVTARDDNFVADYGQDIVGNVLADNGHGADFDLDGGAFQVVAGTVVSTNGITVSIGADGAFIYHASSDFVGLDSFTYTIADAHGTQSTATVHLQINGPDGVIVGTAGADDLVGTLNGETIFGLGGDDTIVAGDGADTLIGGEGADTMYGGKGNDIYYVDNVNDVILENAGGGRDKVFASVSYTLSNNVGDLTLEGTEDINATGNELNNVLQGNSGDNILSGGMGDDTYLFSVGGGQDTVVNTGGADVIRFDSTVPALDVTYAHSTAPGSSDLVISYGANGDTITVRDFFLPGRAISVAFANGTTHSFAHINAQAHIIKGLGDDDTLVAFDDQDTTFYGHEGNDTVIGGAGNDTLVGGAGDDFLSGNDGDDVYIFSTGDGRDVVSDQSGNDEISFSSSVNAQTVSYSYSNEFGSNDLVIQYGAGDVVIVKDFFAGTTGQVAFESQTLFASAGQSLSSGHAKKVLFADGTTHTADQIFALAHTLTGTSGDDVISAFDNANTTISGLTGNDTMFGRAGNDTYIFSAGDGIDTISDIAGVDSIVFNAGVGAETVRYTHVGSDLIIRYGVGTDKITVQGFFSVNAAGQVESVRFSDGTTHSLSYIMQQVHTQIGSANIDNLTGVDYVNNPSDYLYGNDGNDTLSGGLGDDLLDGGRGTDTMFGGAGNDTYYVDKTTDIIVENAGEGIDTVYSSASITLSANVENLNLTGSLSVDGTGNGLNNIIVGNSLGNVLSGGGGDDVLDGGLGPDTLIGGTGNDTYYVDRSTDMVVENADEGIDTVFSSGWHTLAANVENLTLTGNAVINGTGNDLDNVVIGNVSANILVGNGGNDVLKGGGGNDTLRGGEGHDTLYGQAGEDVLFGGGGADTFVFDANTAFGGSDFIKDFNLAEGDKIDIRDLLAGYDPEQGALSDFVQVMRSGNNTILSVDIDGQGVEHSMTQVTLINGFNGLTDIDALIASGNLIVQ